MPLARRLAARIRTQGPIPVSDYMAAALQHYYGSRDPFGRGGDFTTAPEISQMFGELLGLWCAVTWQLMGAPSRVVLAEIGPGRGTLMADCLCAAATVPPFLAACEVHLVETSPSLRKLQKQALKGRKVSWHARFDELPPGPLLLLANELFDALPIRQLVKRAGRWHERMVGLDGDAFVFVAGPEAAPPPFEAADGAIAEVGEAGRELAAAIARRVAGQGGAALAIDYGYAVAAPGDSLQAVRRHAYAAVLEAPGEADLTAHVDFGALAGAASPFARVWGPVTQGEFLSRLGISARAGMLAVGKGPKAAEVIASQLRRLIDPGEMGTLFKALAIADPALPPLPGFEGAP